MAKLYSMTTQEIDGTNYEPGDKINSDTNPGVIAVLQSRGMISDSPPPSSMHTETSGGLQTVDSDPNTIRRNALENMDPADMTRAEMVAHLADLGTSGRTDDEVRNALIAARQRMKQDADDKANEPPEVKASMTKDALEKIAADEEVVFGPDVTNNDHRVAAILEARKARSEA